jgi:anti-anti-sigma factor
MMAAAGIDLPRSGEFRADSSSDGNEIHVVLHGELDLAGVEHAEHALRRAERDGRVIVVDLSGLTFMDAAGLRVMLAANERLGSRLTFRGCTPQVRRLLELTGTDGDLQLVD